MKKHIFALAAIFALVAGSAWAGTDAKNIVGTWKATLGTYSDGTTESDIGMSLTFTSATMTDPMSKTGETHPYTIDEKAKVISIKDGDLQMRLAYSLKAPNVLVLTELTVIKNGKTTSIIGTGATAMFASLEFRK